MIVKNSPETALGAVAVLRLAQLDARDGDLERAIAKLELLQARFDSLAKAGDTAPAPSGPLKAVLARGVPEASLRIPMERVILEAHRFHDLFVANRDPLYGYDPISGPRVATNDLGAGLMDLDPRHDRYVDHLKAIKLQYPRCQIEDNIDLEIAKATPELAVRIERLELLLDTFDDRDAIPEALFRLGVAYKSGKRSADSEAAFARLVRTYPNSIWARQAVCLTPWVPLHRLSRAGL